MCVRIRDVPINRHRQVSAILGGIGIGKIWPILADSLNIITLLIFFRSDRFTSVFFTRQKQFSFYERVYTCYEKKNYTNRKRKNETKKVFNERIAYYFAQLHIAQRDGKNGLLHCITGLFEQSY